MKELLKELLICIIAIIIVTIIAAVFIKIFPNLTYSIGFSAGWLLCLFVNRKTIYYLEKKKEKGKTIKVYDYLVYYHHKYGTRNNISSII